MPDDEKDKYDELEELGDLENIEAELEELPVEQVPDPLGERTEPMDDIQKPAEEQASPDEKQPPKTRSDLGKKIEAAASVRDASEYLRGQRQIKVIKKSAIKSIVDDIIKSYSGMAHQDLLSKIAEYEFNLANMRQDKEALAAQLQAIKDDVALKYEKEIENLKARLAAAEEALSQDISKEKLAKLEEEVVYLRQRVKELEEGLEFAATVEEFDYGMAIESALTQKERTGALMASVEKLLEADPEKQGLQSLKEALAGMNERYDFLVELFKKSQRSYTDLFNKIDGREGSIAVVAELIRLNACNRGWSRELNIREQLIESSETSAR